MKNKTDYANQSNLIKRTISETYKEHGLGYTVNALSVYVTEKDDRYIYKNKEFIDSITPKLCEGIIKTEANNSEDFLPLLIKEYTENVIKELNLKGKVLNKKIK